MRLRKKTTALIGAAILAAGITAGIAGSASASIPDSSGTIHGCYRTTTGELRVVDTGNGGSCYGDETSLTWPGTVPGLQYWSGTDTVGGNDEAYLTCPDNGVPVALYMKNVNDTSGNYEIPTGDNHVYVILGSSGVPDGLGAMISAPGSYPYVLICS